MANSLSLILLLLLPLAPLFAEETITVTAKGIGKSIEDARRSAIQKAVRKALGEMISGNTMAKNGELIKGKVLSYSDGFVSSTTDLESPSYDEAFGFYTLTLQAEVVRSKVVKRLKEVNVCVAEVDGNSLFAQALSKLDKAESGKKLLEKVLNEDLDPAKLIRCELVGLDADDARGRNLMYHNYLTKRQFMWEDDWAILSYSKGLRVSLGKEEHFNVSL